MSIARWPGPGDGPEVRPSPAAEVPERGSITLLSIGFGLLALALILVVTSASAVHIERKRLLSLADAMAVDAANAISLPDYYAALDEPDLGSPANGGAGAPVPLTDTTVRDAAGAYLDSAPSAITDRLHRLRIIEPTGTPDGATAEVSLTALARPPLVPWMLAPWSDGIALRVTATARAD